jgi:hypothetical protein
MKRWRLIRYIRWYLHRRALARWDCAAGRWSWLPQHPADLAYLDAIWKGRK